MYVKIITFGILVLLNSCEDPGVDEPKKNICETKWNNNLINKYLGYHTTVRDVHVDANGRCWIVGEFGVDKLGVPINLQLYGESEQNFTVGYPSSNGVLPYVKPISIDGNKSEYCAILLANGAVINCDTLGNIGLLGSTVDGHKEIFVMSDGAAVLTGGPKGVSTIKNSQCSSISWSKNEMIEILNSSKSALFDKVAMVGKVLNNSYYLLIYDNISTSIRQYEIRFQDVIANQELVGNISVGFLNENRILLAFSVSRYANFVYACHTKNDCVVFERKVGEIDYPSHQVVPISECEAVIICDRGVMSRYIDMELIKIEKFRSDEVMSLWCADWNNGTVLIGYQKSDGSGVLFTSR